MVDGVVSGEGAVCIRRWDVWLVRRRDGGSKGPVGAAVLLGVGQGYGLGIVVLWVVLLLLGLWWVSIAAVVAARGGRCRRLAQLLGAMLAHEQLVVCARRVAVAPGWRGIAIGGGASVGLVGVVCVGRPAMVGVWILRGCASRTRVRYAGVVVVLAVAVVRHGGEGALRGLGGRDGGWVRSKSSFTRLSGNDVARAPWPGPAELRGEVRQPSPRRSRRSRTKVLRLAVRRAVACAGLRLRPSDGVGRDAGACLESSECVCASVARGTGRRGARRAGWEESQTTAAMRQGGLGRSDCWQTAVGLFGVLDGAKSYGVSAAALRADPRVPCPSSQHRALTSLVRCATWPAFASSDPRPVHGRSLLPCGRLARVAGCASLSSTAFLPLCTRSAASAPPQVCHSFSQGLSTTAAFGTAGLELRPINEHVYSERRAPRLTLVTRNTRSTARQLCPTHTQC